MYNQSQMEKYFERINYKGTIDISLENLTLLQKGHLYNIPYENLDQMNSVPLSLTSEGVFEKIVTNHRGGYCFENQGLLCYALRTLG